MKAFNADEGDNAGSHCFLCKKEIPPATWFARIQAGDRRVLFCRPHCVEVFLEKGRPFETDMGSNHCLPAGNKKSERIANERRAAFSTESKVAP
jgi:hypothetical protein